MSAVKNSEYQNDITYIVDYFVEETEYQPWKNRLTDQLLKNVSVQGFRKGKVPREVALKRVDPALLAETVIKETLERYAQDAVVELNAKMKEDDRIIQNIEINVDPEVTGERDNGFAFRLIAKLLPNIDLEVLDTITIDQPSPDEISNRPGKEDFVKSEQARFLKTYNEYTPTGEGAKKGDKVVCDLDGSVDGVKDSKLKSPSVEIVLGAGEFLPEIEKALPEMKPGESKEVQVSFPESYFEQTVAGKKATFTVSCKEVLKPKFTTLDEVFEHNKEVQDQFHSYPEFIEFLGKFYDDETDRLLEELRQRKIIQTVVTTVPDFSLPEDRVESETNRIFAAVKEDAQTRKTSLYEAFTRSGIPSDGAKLNADEIEIRALIELYVRNEFKLSGILHTIYERLVDNKITTPQLDRAVEEVKKNPTQFGIAPGSDDDTIRRHTMDRLQRQEGARHLFNTFNPDTHHNHSHAKKDDSNDSKITDVNSKKKTAKASKSSSKKVK